MSGHLPWMKLLWNLSIGSSQCSIKSFGICSDARLRRDVSIALPEMIVKTDATATRQE